MSSAPGGSRRGRRLLCAGLGVAALAALVAGGASAESSALKGTIPPDPYVVGLGKIAIPPDPYVVADA